MLFRSDCVCSFPHFMAMGQQSALACAIAKCLSKQIGHANSELSAYVIEISNEADTKISQNLIGCSTNTQSRVLYADWLYWKTVSRQLNTLTGFISITEGGQLTLTLSVDSL